MVASVRARARGRLGMWVWRYGGAYESDGEEFWEPYDYITGFIVNQLHLKVGITGTMPSRKTRLRSSLACAFAQRPSSWASQAHRVPVAGPAHRHDAQSQTPVLETVSRRAKKKVFQCDPLVTPESIRAGQTAAAEAAEAFFFRNTWACLFFRRTTHQCLFILFLTVRLRWMVSSSIQASSAYQIAAWIRRNTITRCH